jgi:hypothetical protein
VSYQIQLTARDSQGRTYVVATSFGATLALPASCIFRLQPDGTLDPSFPVTALTDAIDRFWATAGKLCYRASYREVDLDHTFARLTEQGQPDTAFPRFHFDPIWPSPNADAPVYPAATFDTTGGFIITSTEGDWSGLVRYDASGQRDARFAVQLDKSIGAITDLQQLPDGGILVSGSFTSLNGVLTGGHARLSVATKDPSTHLANLSIRTTAGVGEQTLIAGFVISGEVGTRAVLMRGVGPGLVPLGLNAQDVIADPQLTLFKGSSVAARNDNWDSSLDPTANDLGAFPLTRGSKDAALFSTLAPGAYTAHVSGTNNTSGTALIELYDADPAPPSSSTARLVNISGRAHVGTGDNVLIAGFVLSGNSTKRLLIRAIGPGLKKQGLTDVLGDPELLIYQGNRMILSNDNWNAGDASAFAAVGAFPLDDGSKDSALIIDLPAGVYTAVVHGLGGSTGSALVEVYEVP